MLAISERALRRLQEYRDVIPRDTLNALPVVTPGSYWTADVKTELFSRIGEAFVKLLRGELPADAWTWPVL